VAGKAGDQVTTTIIIRLSERMVAHLEEMVADFHVHGGREMTVALLCKQVIENYVVDRRSAKRMQAPEHHYTARNADDYSDSE
jgi:hypothetical protein